MSLMLLLPVLQPGWVIPKTNLYTYKWLMRFVLFSVIVLLVIVRPSELDMMLNVLFFTALPEEWFFRVFLMMQLQALIARNNFFIRLHQNELSSANAINNIFIIVKANVYKLLKPANFANLAVSLFFALLHLPTQGWSGLSVFIPSLIFGRIYQANNDLLLVLLLHALSNMVFYLYIRELIFK